LQLTDPAWLQAADVAAARRQRFSVFILAYTTTLREGIESVLFLTSVSASTGAESIPIPGIIGVLLGVLTGMALFYRHASGQSSGAQEEEQCPSLGSTLLLLFCSSRLWSSGLSLAFQHAENTLLHRPIANTSGLSSLRLGVDRIMHIYDVTMYV
jgi:high-affinity Fe2+/Pb2+ permease